MKNSNEILQRLFRAAAGPVPKSEMPFGFDTRVLAVVEESRSADFVAAWAGRTAVVALIVIGLAAAGVYRKSILENEFSSEYAMVDNVIDKQLAR